jgi:hypothetical protein
MVSEGKCYFLSLSQQSEQGTVSFEEIRFDQQDSQSAIPEAQM